MCTGIGLSCKNKYFVGKNHDWISKYAYIVINPRKMLNHAQSYLHEQKLLYWESIYGSITVNLTDTKGNVIPGAMAGLNEKGLSVLTLWLAQSEYPTVNTQTVVPSELFAKYFLDNAKTVQDAINLAQKIDIEPSVLSQNNLSQLVKTLGLGPNVPDKVTVHLYIQDENGDAAVISYINKKLIIHSGKAMEIFALANDPYDESVKYTKQFHGFGGNNPIPSEFDAFPAFANSLQRFARVAYALKIMPKIETEQQAISYVFNNLSYAQNPLPNTQWTAVFDLSDKTMYLRSIENQQIRIIRLNKFDISEGQPLKFLSINNNLSGYVESEFKEIDKNLKI